MKSLRLERAVYALDDKGGVLNAPPSPRKQLDHAELQEREGPAAFRDVSENLLRAQYELQQLHALFFTQGNLTTLERVEHVSTSSSLEHRNVGLAVTKKREHLAAAHAVLDDGVKKARREIELQNAFMNELKELASRWRLVVPEHGPTVAHVKSDEPLAFDCGGGGGGSGGGGGGGGPLFVSRDDGNDGAVVVSAQPVQKLVARAQSGAEVRGTAVLDFPARTHALAIEDVLESARRSALARALLHGLPAEPIFRLGDDLSLVFELVAVEASPPVQRPGTLDSVCDAALLALRTGHDLLGAARQALRWPQLCAKLEKVVPACKLACSHDGPVVSRCVVELGDSAAWWAEVIMRAGEVEMGGYAHGVFASRDAPAVASMDDVVEAIKSAVQLAAVRELHDVAAAMRREDLVVDVCALPKPSLTVCTRAAALVDPVLEVTTQWTDALLVSMRRRGAGAKLQVMARPYAQEFRRVVMSL